MVNNVLLINNKSVFAVFAFWVSKMPGSVWDRFHNGINMVLATKISTYNFLLFGNAKILWFRTISHCLAYFTFYRRKRRVQGIHFCFPTHNREQTMRGTLFPLLQQEKKNEGYTLFPLLQQGGTSEYHNKQEYIILRRVSNSKLPPY